MQISLIQNESSCFKNVYFLITFIQFKIFKTTSDKNGIKESFKVDLEYNECY